MYTKAICRGPNSMLIRFKFDSTTFIIEITLLDHRAKNQFPCYPIPPSLKIDKSFPRFGDKAVKNTYLWGFQDNVSLPIFATH